MLFSFSLTFLAVVAAGWWAGRFGSRSEADYYLAGRSYGPFVIGLSAFASGNSGFLMIGCVGLGYLTGLSAYALPLGVMLGDWAYWTYLAPRVHAATPAATNTVPERIALGVDLHRRELVRRVASAILIVCLCTYAAAQIHAVGISLERAFSVDISIAIISYLIVIGSYTAVGGFRSSVLASLIHGAIMLATTCIVLVGIVYTFSKMAVPIDVLMEVLAGASEGLATTGSTGFMLQVIGFVGLGIGLGLGLPTLLVKVFALRDTGGIHIAKWTYIGFTHGVLVTMISLGILLHVLVPGIENPELGLFEFSSEYLHPVLTGIVLAGVVAAISSTFEAVLVILSSAVGADFLGNFVAGLGDRAARVAHAFITAIIAVLVAVIALTTTATVFQIVIYSISALSSAFAPAMIITTFGWRTSATALVVSMCTGFAVNVLWIATGLDGALNGVLPASAVALAAHYLASSGTRK